MELSILKKAGLSEGEIKIYGILLNIGRSPLSKIHEKAGMERRNIYDILNKLTEKGLVTYSQENNKKSFNISNPNKILSYLEEKKKLISNIQEDINEVLPSIMSKFDSNKEEIKSETFKGKEGIKAVWEDMLNYKEIRWIGSGNYMPSKFPAFFEDWNKRRNKKKIKSYHLFRYEIKNDLIKGSGEARFLSKEFSGSPTVTAIYGNKVVQFLFGDFLFAFVIESEELAENYLTYHKHLWKTAKP